MSSAIREPFAVDVVRSIRFRITFLILLSLLALNVWPAPTTQKTLMVYGDSLSAAYGLDIKDGWVTLLEQRLRKTHPDWQIINLSISGETTAGGLSRLPKALEQHQPDLILLELGANDGLRGTSLKSFKSNLESMLQLAQKQNVDVIMFEMQIPPNYGPAYTRRFTQTFHDLGQAYDVPVIPFFLDGIAGVEELNQKDGIHPKAEAQPKLLSNIWPDLEPMLK